MRLELSFNDFDINLLTGHHGLCLRLRGLRRWRLCGRSTRPEMSLWRVLGKKYWLKWASGLRKTHILPPPYTQALKRSLTRKEDIKQLLQSEHYQCTHVHKTQNEMAIPSLISCRTTELLRREEAPIGPAWSRTPHVSIQSHERAAPCQ